MTDRAGKDRIRSAVGEHRKRVTTLAEHFHEAMRHASTTDQKATLAEEFDLRLGRIIREFRHG